MSQTKGHTWTIANRHCLHILATHYPNSTWLLRGAIFNHVFYTNLAYSYVRDEYGGHKHGRRGMPTKPSRSLMWNDHICRDEFHLPGPFDATQQADRAIVLQQIQNAINFLGFGNRPGLGAVNMVPGMVRADTNTVAGGAPPPAVPAAPRPPPPVHSMVTRRSAAAATAQPAATMPPAAAPPATAPPAQMVAPPAPMVAPPAQMVPPPAQMVASTAPMIAQPAPVTAGPSNAGSAALHHPTAGPATSRSGPSIPPRMRLSDQSPAAAAATRPVPAPAATAPVATTPADGEPDYLGNGTFPGPEDPRWRSREGISWSMWGGRAWYHSMELQPYAGTPGLFAYAPFRGLNYDPENTPARTWKRRVWFSPHITREVQVCDMPTCPTCSNARLIRGD